MVISTTDSKENQSNNLCYIYKHIRLDRNEVFYIGKGTNSSGRYTRANEIGNRTKYWSNIVKKYGYRVEIVIENLSEEDAHKKEIELILHYGRIDLGTGTLVNLTSGGTGSPDVRVSKDTRKKLSNTRYKIKLELYDCNGLLEEVFDSMSNSSLVKGFDPSTIKKCVGGKFKYHKGYKFEKINDTLIRAYPQTDSEKIMQEKNVIINLNKGKEAILVGLELYDTDERFIKSYKSLIEAEYDGFNRHSINSQSKGKMLDHNGFRFIRINKKLYHGIKLSELEINEIEMQHKHNRTIGKNKVKVKVVFYDFYGLLLKEYKSLCESKKDGFHPGNIMDCANGKRGTHKKFSYKKISENLIHGYKIKP